MKKPVAILLLFSILLQCLAPLAVLGLFRLNQDYIARNLCENRNAPEKKCCGKCYLRKQLKKVSDEENSTSHGSTIKIEKTEIVCLLPPAALQFAAPAVFHVPAVVNPRVHHFLVALFPVSVFHPPSCSC